MTPYLARRLQITLAKGIISADALPQQLDSLMQRERREEEGSDDREKSASIKRPIKCGFVRSCGFLEV
jgi:hypothetical protein